ncbi:hypothetical protein XHV734_3315 [Xanthomonas hortorum pv. vitians]|nr:hypothetical protein XHV734_3315 [Xanthomonas hortorum pv. vitians]
MQHVQRPTCSSNLARPLLVNPFVFELRATATPARETAFAEVDPLLKALIEVMDRANAKFGRSSMAFGSSAKRVRGGEQRRPTRLGGIR